MRKFWLIALIFLLTTALSGLTTAQTDLEADIQAAMDDSPITDMVVVLGDADGVQFSTTKGDFDMETAVPIASASKWYTAATILALVDAEIMALDDTPAAYFDWWTADPADPRSQITVAMLLSFTSGLNADDDAIDCTRLNARNTSNEECAQQIYDTGITSEPGNTFEYGSSHMHLLGAMAEAVTDEHFNTLFRDYIADPLEMSDATGIPLASIANPHPAGGFVSTAADYALFMQSLLNRDLFSDDLYDAMFTNQTTEIDNFIGMARAIRASDNPWQYAFGAWVECPDAECLESQIFSSGGAFGWFPWVDFENGYWGIVGQRGDFATRPVVQSIELAAEIRPLAIDHFNP